MGYYDRVKDHIGEMKWSGIKANLKNKVKDNIVTAIEDNVQDMSEADLIAYIHTIITEDDLNALERHEITSPFTDDTNWKYVDIDAFVKEQTEKTAPIEKQYIAGCEIFENARTKHDYKKALELLEPIKGYKDSAEKIGKIKKWLENEEKYVDCLQQLSTTSDASVIQRACDSLNGIRGFKSSRSMAKICEEFLAENREYSKRSSEKGDVKTVGITGGVFIAIGICPFLFGWGALLKLLGIASIVCGGILMFALTYVPQMGNYAKTNDDEHERKLKKVNEEAKRLLNNNG